MEFVNENPMLKNFQENRLHNFSNLSYFKKLWIDFDNSKNPKSNINLYFINILFVITKSHLKFFCFVSIVTLAFWSGDVKDIEDVLCYLLLKGKKIKFTLLSSCII